MTEDYSEAVVVYLAGSIAIGVLLGLLMVWVLR